MFSYQLESSCRLPRVLGNDVNRIGSLSLWLAFRMLPALLVASMGLIMAFSTPVHSEVVYSAAPHSSDESSASELSDLGAGQLTLQAKGGKAQPAVMQKSKVHFAVSGMIAVVTLEQTFTNTGPDWVEGVYRFPLPDDAAVRALQVEVGERRIVGKVRERAIAKKVYEAARSAGKKASLVTQQRPNLFTNRVANIAPGESVTVHLEYVQRAAFERGQFALRFPMTITPRYRPRPTPAELATQTPIEIPTEILATLPKIAAYSVSNDAADFQPSNPIEITVSLDAGMPLAGVDSLYHEIVLARRAGVYEVTLAGGSSEMDRDFVLNWRPVAGSTPTAAFFSEQVEGEHYGLLMLLPPGEQHQVEAMPRELIIVVDTSGSMGGVSIAQARASVSEALLQLKADDRFNIIEFNSNHRALYRESMPATPHYVQQAREFVRQLSASGGTEMLGALQAALVGPEQALLRDRALLRQVIFITDGAVGNEQALFASIRALLGDNRLFTVGIGSAPNSWFMRKAAEFGRGTHTHIGDINEVAQKMRILFDQLARPAALDIDVSWPGKVEAWPQRVPDLYFGEPLLVAVKFSEQSVVGKATVSGLTGGQPWQRSLELIAEGSELGTQHRGVGSLWARYKIAGLLDEKTLGRNEEDIRGEVLPVALAHQLLSPYTSFVAVEEVVSRPLDALQESALVPNMRPKGQSPQAYAYPQTATTGPARVWFGALLIALAVLVRSMRQPEA